MRRHRHSYGLGRAIPSAPTEGDFQCFPRLWSKDASKPAVLAFHGAGGTALGSMVNPSIVPGSYRFHHQFGANLGCPVVAHDVGGTLNWGNPTAQLRAGQLRTYAQSSAVGGKPGKVILIGVSMGNVLCMNYAKNHPDRVAAIITAIGACDLNDIRDNNRLGLRAGISDAWGTGTWTAPGTPPLPAGADPIDYPGQLAQIPWLAYAADFDSVCLPAKIDELAALCGRGSVVRSAGPFDHSDDAVGYAADDFEYQRDWLHDVGAL